MKKNERTDEEYIEAAKNSTSIAGMCKYLGRSPYGAGYYIMHKKIKELGIDTSHFKGQGWNKEGINLKRTRIPDEEVFVENSDYQTSRLRQRLIEGQYREYRCERCKNIEWEGEPIPLEVHHINGIHNDNRLENLQILCPNCHALTDNYCSKNIKKRECGGTVDALVPNTSGDTPREGSIPSIPTKKTSVCQNSGKVFSNENGSKYCSEVCYHTSTHKSNVDITKDLLIELFKNKKTFVGVGKTLNISDNATRKWCKKFGLPTKTKDMLKYIAGVLEW